jgi:polyisoprenoid-binding protein YceI
MSTMINKNSFRPRAFLVGATAALALALFLSAAAAPPRQQARPTSNPEIVLTLDPAQSKVHFNVDSSLHTVHGTFNLKSGTVHFDPETGKAGGEAIVLATSGDSGSNGRDHRMHKEILETAKFPDAVFHPTQVEGKVAASGASDVKLRGTFTLHGADHDLTALVHVELSGDHWKGTAKFEVPYVAWGIKDPSNFLFKVKKVVDVELEMSGAMQVPPANP